MNESTSEIAQAIPLERAEKPGITDEGKNVVTAATEQADGIVLRFKNLIVHEAVRHPVIETEESLGDAEVDLAPEISAMDKLRADIEKLNIQFAGEKSEDELDIAA